jgi:hypothetical protein
VYACIARVLPASTTILVAAFSSQKPAGSRPTVVWDLDRSRNVWACWIDCLPSMQGWPNQWVYTKDFNFVITKISVTTEITEFHKIQSKFHQKFFRDQDMKYVISKKV